MKINLTLAILASSLSLIGCGGGGGGGSTTTPVVTPPTTVAQATLVTSVPAATYAANTPESGVYAQTNLIRGQCGFGLLTQKTQLDQAGADHANYVENSNDPNRFSHTESAAFTLFTGVDPSARALFRGYAGGADEVLGGDSFVTGTSPTAQQGIEFVIGMMASPYHGNALIGTYRDFGSGWTLNQLTQSAGLQPEITIAAELAGAQQQLAGDTVATYPCNGMTSSYTTLYKGEIPAPFPDSAYTNFKRGASVFVKVRQGQVLTLTTLALSDPTGNLIAGRQLTADNDPNQHLTTDTIVFSPDLPLATSTHYALHIVGTNNGVAFDKTITYTTGSL